MATKSDVDIRWALRAVVDTLADAGGYNDLVAWRQQRASLVRQIGDLDGVGDDSEVLHLLKAAAPVLREAVPAFTDLRSCKSWARRRTRLLDIIAAVTGED